MKTSYLAGAFVLVSVLMGVGVRGIADAQRIAGGLTARTIATVTGKEMKIRSAGGGRRTSAGPTGSHPGSGHSVSFSPIVRYEYYVDGRRYPGDRLYPVEFSIGGNIGRLFVAADLEAYDVGARVPVHYDPSRPYSSSLRRRPAFFGYLFLLAGAVAGCVVSLVQLSAPGAQLTDRRRGSRVVIAFWYVVGLGAAAHFAWLAGADWGTFTAAVFGAYLIGGLLLLDRAFSGPRVRAFVKQLGDAVFLALIAAFFGMWAGLGLMFVSDLFGASATFRTNCFRYGLVLPAVAMFVISMLFKPRENTR